MSMSRKDYVLIAAAISDTADYANPGALAGVRLTAEQLATDFARTNPNFDRAKFLAACGFPKPY